MATSPAVAQICNRLNLDLVGICASSSDLPERYGSVYGGHGDESGLEIIKSSSDYILSPALCKTIYSPNTPPVERNPCFWT